MSAQDKLDRSAAKHGLGSDERKRKIQKAKDFFSKPVPTYSKDELRKMGHPVEQNESRFDITFPEPTAKNTARKNPAASARNRANAEKHKDKIQKAIARDKARSASGSLTRTDDHRRKNYQTGKSGAHFSKYESSAEYGKSMDRIRDKEKNAAIKPKDRETLGKLADLMKKQKRNEAYRKPTQAEIDADKRKDGKSKDSSTKYKNMKKKMYGNAMSGLKNEEKMYSVKYTHPTDKKSGKTTGPLSKAAADKKAAMGNRVDRVGGKYTVIPHVETAGQEYTAVPTKTGDVSQADRLTIAKMDAIMKKRSKDKRQKEDWKADSARRMRNQRIANEPYRGPSEPDTRTDAERMADRAKLAKRFAADKAKQDKAMASKKESVNLEETNESSLPPHLQKIIGKDGQIDKKKVDQHVHGKKTKVTDVTPKGYGPKEEDVDEATMADRTVLRAVRIAKDMAGNHTGASKRIEKMKKGLSDHPKVKDALRLANESVATADKKPQNFRDPATGKLKVRMVPVDRDVVRSDDAARVVRKKRFKHLRSK